MKLVRPEGAAINISFHAIKSPGWSPGLGHLAGFISAIPGFSHPFK